MEAFIKSGDAEVADFCMGREWHVIESFGRWMRDRTAKLEFTISKASDEPIRVMMEYRVAPWISKTAMQITVNGQLFSKIDLKPGESQIMLFETLPENGSVAIDFEIAGEIPEAPEPERRKNLCFGVSSISVASQTDLLARLMQLEAIAFANPNVTTLINSEV